MPQRNLVSKTAPPPKYKREKIFFSPKMFINQSTISCPMLHPRWEIGHSSRTAGQETVGEPCSLCPAVTLPTMWFLLVPRICVLSDILNSTNISLQPNNKFWKKLTASAKSGLNFNKLFSSFCKEAGVRALVSSFFNKAAWKLKWQQLEGEHQQTGNHRATYIAWRFTLISLNTAFF